jgi:hypothetical protein
VSRQLLAEFRDPDAVTRALGPVRAGGSRALDAFSPLPIEGLAEALELPPARIRFPMLLAGLAFAALGYAVQWYSAVLDYPINVGGRPLHSWPVFLLVPFEVAVFAAALAGVIAMIRACGLPRLHHPVFAVAGFERASQDRVFLLAETDGPIEDLRHVLERAGALAVTLVRP